MADEAPRPPDRLATGVRGLDSVLSGGLFRGLVYLLAGAPGSGKTILANQIAYEQARRGGRVLYVTLMAESHGQILWQLSGFSFFDAALSGDAVRYLNAYNHLEDAGLTGLRDVLRDAVRAAKASLLVLDGVVSAEVLARSETEYKRFVQDLQSWCGLVGCSVLLLTSAGGDEETRPEHTMVDGILLLQGRSVGMRRVRQLRVTKLRGSPFLEGDHVYDIGDAGLVVYPRLEARVRGSAPARRGIAPVTTGVPGLDELLGGGIDADSSTLVLGTSGSGKTILGMQFLDAGARSGERGLHFGFYENESTLRRKADRLGFQWGEHLDAGRLHVLWQPPAEQQLDMLARRLLDHVAAHEVKRVFIDGLVGFKEAAVQPERLGPFFAVLKNELHARGVVTMMTDETRELLVREAHTPTEGLSALCENILFLCQIETRAELERLLCVLKVRCSAHARRLYHVAVGPGGLRVLGQAPHDETVFVSKGPPQRDRDG
jgi:circadian clock protein KaiC